MESKLLIILILLTVSILGLLLCKKEIKPPTTTTTSSTTTSISTSTTTMLTSTTISPRNQQGCYDSDGGKNYYEKGTTYIGGCFSDPETGATSCYVSKPINDTCIDNNRLKEYYCEDYSIKHINYTCPKECKDGKCIENIELIVKDTYKQGEDIEIKVKNNMNESIYYDSSGCGPISSYLVVFKNGPYNIETINPCLPCPTLLKIEEIKPLHTIKIDVWDQKCYYRTLIQENCDYRCGWTMAKPGKYMIIFVYSFDKNLENKTSIEKEFEII